jgi:hypothetical protein
MSCRYEFQRAVTVDGTKVKQGAIWQEDQFPSGSLPNCIRMGHVVPLPDDAVPDQSEPVKAETEVAPTAPTTTRRRQSQGNVTDNLPAAE